LGLVIDGVRRPGALQPGDAAPQGVAPGRGILARIVQRTSREAAATAGLAGRTDDPLPAPE